MLSPTQADLSNSRDFFRHLLARPTTEREWQGFFTQHPYVLSRSLPVRLEPADILPLGRPGYAEPDFAFYPRGVHPVPFYGVIELKRPESRIASFPRSNVAILTRDAETAIQQVTRYATPPWPFFPEELNERPLFLGNNAYLFIIMGMSTELVDRVGMEIYRDALDRRLPGNLQLLPYDTLLHHFEAGLPRVFFLVAIEPETKREAPVELERDDECILDENGNCINPNQKHWGANE